MLVGAPSFTILAKCTNCGDANVCFEKVNYDDPVNESVRGQYCLNCILSHQVADPDGLGFGSW